MKTYLYILAALLLSVSISYKTAAQSLTHAGGPFGGMVGSLVAQQNDMYCGLQTGGLYKSSDEGMNWTLMNLPGDPYDRIFTAFADNQRVLASTSKNLYRSGDAGATWQVLPYQYVTDIAALGTGYIAVRNGDTVMTSDATGQNWTDIYVFTPASTAPQKSGIMVVGDTVYLGSKGRGVYKSYDGGHTWSARNTGINMGETSSFFKSNNRIYMSSNTGVYYSDDLGAYWNLMSINGLNCLNVRYVFIYNDSIFSNAFVSPVLYDSASNYWVGCTQTTAPTTCYLSLNGKLFCGTMNGVFMMNTGFNDWQWRSNGLKGILPRPVVSNGTEMLASGFDCIDASSDNGLSWQWIAQQSPYSIGSNPLYYMGDTVVFSTEAGLYYTTDRFATAVNMASGFSMPGFSGVVLYVKNTNRFIMCVPDTGSLQFDALPYYSDNWGTSWTKCTGTPAVAWPAYMLLEAGDKLYASFPTTDTLYQSSDNGASWIPLSNYTSYAQSGCYLNSTVYFASIAGVSYSTDSGSTWGLIGSWSADRISNLITFNNDVYGLSGYNLYKLDRVNNIWNIVGVTPDSSLFLQNMGVHGNHLFIGTSGNSFLYYGPQIASGEPVVLEPVNMMIFPNPSSKGTVQLSLDNEMIGSKLEVFDASGKLVYKSVVTNAQSQISTGGFSSGMYIASVNNGQKKMSRKFVVE